MSKSALAGVLLLSIAAQGGLTGVLLSPDDDGLISGGKTWVSQGEGLCVSWFISRNDDGSWHYRYAFANAAGGSLQKPVHHLIFSISPYLTASDVFNPGGSIRKMELKNWGASPSNPGLPAESIRGLKVSLYEGQSAAEFDSFGAPMWADVYFKGGGKPKNFAYNASFGIQTSNLTDYLGLPVDAGGHPLFKIVAPNRLPEPATMTILCGGLVMMALKLS
ncbi:MAG: hypothetical protein LLF76_09000 [Planctomycetaceae bacterium]|nr:hypothetical protein [Planctomycetaceae bacterium]